MASLLELAIAGRLTCMGIDARDPEEGYPAGAYVHCADAGTEKVLVGSGTSMLNWYMCPRHAQQYTS